MCSNYDACTDTERLRLHFGVTLPPGTNLRTDVWPTYSAPFVRRHPNADVGDDAVPPREALQGLFGLVPHWAGEVAFGRRTYNARSETVAEKPSFRDAWRKGQHCIVPVEAVVEPDWRSGKVIPTKIKRKDGLPMGIAGLWASKRLESGEELLSFTMLTVNADDHELFKHFHKPDDEKRMVVILHEHLRASDVLSLALHIGYGAAVPVLCCGPDGCGLAVTQIGKCLARALTEGLGFFWCIDPADAHRHLFIGTWLATTGGEGVAVGDGDHEAKEDC